MMIYLFLVNVSFAIGFMLYHFVFRNLTFFQYNRYYLLGVLLLSLVIPLGIFMDFSLFWNNSKQLQVMQLPNILEVVVLSDMSAHPTFDWVKSITILYWTVVGISITMFIYKLWRLQRAFKEESAHDSFSFFGRVKVGSDVRCIREISNHELVHVKQGHSYDLIFVEIIQVFNWFNPFVYYLKKELKFQHECIADEICSTDKVSYAKLLIAHAMKTDVNMLSHEFSNQSFLKQRINMLFKNKSINSKKFFYLSVFPIVGIVAFSTVAFSTAKGTHLVDIVESKIEKVNFPLQQLSAGDRQMMTENLALDTISKRSEKKANQVGKSATELFNTVEISPEPVGGMRAFRQWIGENYEYPQEAIDAGVKGTIQLYFIVEKDGSLSDIKVIQDLGYKTGDAAVKMLQKAEKWSPGIDNGKKVRVSFTLPIKLDLTATDESNSSQ